LSGSRPSTDSGNLDFLTLFPDEIDDGLGARAIVLAGHLLNSSFGNSEIRRERLFPRYQQKYQQNGRCREFLRVFSMHREKIRIEPAP
jgi:hypothetical protein